MSRTVSYTHLDVYKRQPLLDKYEFPGDEVPVVRGSALKALECCLLYTSFWAHRLAWFHEQADKGLLGEIDLEKTRNGTIVCKDGFVATTFSEDKLKKLGEESGCHYCIEEVDESSLFLILKKPDGI